MRSVEGKALIGHVGVAVSNAQHDSKLERRRKEMRRTLNLPDDSAGRRALGARPEAVEAVAKLFADELGRRNKATAEVKGSEAAVDEVVGLHPYAASDVAEIETADGRQDAYQMDADAAAEAWRLLDSGVRIFNCDAIVCVVDSHTYGMTHDQAEAFGDPPLNRGSALLTRCELACAQAQAKPVLPLLRLRQLPSHLPRALSLHHCTYLLTYIHGTHLKRARG